MTTDGGIVDLDLAECLELLASDTVGRVAFVTPDGPRIVPVNYVVAGDSVEFRTAAYSELATYAPESAARVQLHWLVVAPELARCSGAANHRLVD